MTIWPPRRGLLRRPAYRSLAETVTRAVEAGELKTGDRMPTHRDLAYDLGVSVQTVSRAYDELIRAGVLVGEVGRGTYVRATASEPRTPYLPERQYGSIIDLSLLKPVFAPLHEAAMRQSLERLSQDLPMTTIASFRPSAALRKYNDAAVEWLALCGLTVAPPSLLLTNGNTAAMTTALMTAANPGDLIVAEELGHHTLRPLTSYLGMRLRGLPIDAEGIEPEGFERACLREPVKAIHLMPTGLAPKPATMGTQRRQAIIDIARRHDVLIIENDAWGPIHPDRPPPIAALAPERTFYFTSLTKCIMPGLRVGFLVVPETHESSAANRHLVTNWMATPLMAEIAMRWIADGTAERLLTWQKSALAERNAATARILGGLDLLSSPNGMHVWLPLPDAWPEEDFFAHARLHGVAVAPGSSFCLADPKRHAGVRLCLGGESGERLELGLQIVRRLIRSRPEPALLAI
ncbi:MULTISPECIES: PLP-dependent aminotransferase family protein [unclassified Roseitalea]|uniref:MocR-like ectoine utilization transcription factor EhuR n=1 Tax=unclassified Roseitalea TaxID=2639107 RepID=UPI00273D5AB3|nr:MULTISPECIES: PLP-dependent aminotransferase family protein [unclassified Roseitalea]